MGARINFCKLQGQDTNVILVLENVSLKKVNDLFYFFLNNKTHVYIITNLEMRGKQMRRNSSKVDFSFPEGAQMRRNLLKNQKFLFTK
jgi:uncharacterized protein YhbP (UPF0306 family)